MSGKSSIEAGRGHVLLSAESGPLERGLAAASTTLKAWAGGVAAIATGAAAGATAMLAPFTAGITTFISMGNEMQMMSSRTGATVEALSELTGVASQFGATAEDVEKSLRGMSKIIVEASAGSDSAAGALRSLGISLSELQGLSPDQQFERFASAFASIEDPALRATLANQVFSESGAKMMGFLRAGPGEIARLRGELREMGLVMSGSDAEAAKSLSKDWKMLVETGKMIVFQFGAAIAPTVKQLAGYFISAASATNKFFQENRGLLQVVFLGGAALAGLAASLALLSGGLYVVGILVGGVSAALVACGGVFGLLKASIILGVPGLASAFGLFKAAVWAWGMATAGASLLARGAMASFGFTAVATMFAVKAAAFTLAGALLVIPIAILAIKLAVLSVAVVVGVLVTAVAATLLGAIALIPPAVAYFTARWLWGLQAVQSAIAAVRRVFGVVFDWIVSTVGSVVGWIARRFMDVFGPLIGAIGSALSRIGTMISNITSIVSSAVSATVSGFTTLFSGLVATATTAWGGIRDSFAVGDWAGMWEIVQVAARLAWLQIQDFLYATWNTWKFAGIAIWNEVTDGLYDAFVGIWTELKILFAESWAFLKVGFFDAIVSIYHRWTTIWQQMMSAADRLNPVLNDQQRQARQDERAASAQETEQGFRDASALAFQEGRGARLRVMAQRGDLGRGIEDAIIRASEALFQYTAEEEANLEMWGELTAEQRAAVAARRLALAAQQAARPRQAGDPTTEAENEAILRLQRDEANRALQRAQAGGAGNAAEIARLQVQLDTLNLNAWIAAEQQRIQGAGGMAGAPASDGLAAQSRTMSVVNSVAGAIFGQLGATSAAIDPAIVLQRQQLAAAQQAARDINRAVDELRDIGRNVVVRFG